MSFSSLQSFTKYLEKIGQLKRIKIPVSTNLEITEIQSRVIAKEGPALLFENVNNEYSCSSKPIWNSRKNCSWN